MTHTICLNCMMKVQTEVVGMRAAKSKRPTHMATEHRPATPVSVMVVDDEQPIRTLLARWLAHWGYASSVAASALQALEMMRACPADIAVVDLRMPGRDGIWLAAQLRDGWPKTIVLFTTGAVEVDVIEELKQSGALDCVTKPFESFLFQESLERAAHVFASSKSF